jgi:DNA (cytosine-5)-methyltransferase 1
MPYRLLDLFCGDGGASMGYHRAGFEVVGVDNKPHPRYPFEFHQADALQFPLDGFDVVHASPPCQAYSSLRHLQNGKVYPELISETRERLVRSEALWVIENVDGAPLGSAGHLVMLCGTMFGLGTPSGSAELRRHRLFEISVSIGLRPACEHGTGVISIHGDHARDRRRGVISVVGHTPVAPRSQSRRVINVVGKTADSIRKTISVTGATPQTNVVRNRDRCTYSIEEAKAAMGIDWMAMKGLSQAIPPAYTEFIGRQLIEALKA